MILATMFTTSLGGAPSSNTHSKDRQNIRNVSISFWNLNALEILQSTAAGKRPKLLNHGGYSVHTIPSLLTQFSTPQAPLTRGSSWRIYGYYSYRQHVSITHPCPGCRGGSSWRCSSPPAECKPRSSSDKHRADSERQTASGSEIPSPAGWASWVCAAPTHIILFLCFSMKCQVNNLM